MSFAQHYCNFLWYGPEKQVTDVLKKQGRLKTRCPVLLSCPLLHVPACGLYFIICPMGIYVPVYSLNSFTKVLLSRSIAIMFGITINPTAMSASDQMASMGMVTARIGGRKKNH